MAIIKGKVLQFDSISKNNVIFRQDCAIEIPQEVPLFIEPYHVGQLAVGTCKLERLDDCVMVTVIHIYSDTLLHLLKTEKIGAGGIYTGAKHHIENGVTIVDKCRLSCVLATLHPAQEECYLELIGEEEWNNGESR